MCADVRFGVLGTLNVVTGGAPVPIPAGRQRVLLASLLLSANQTVPVDRLAGQLWMEEQPARLRGALQTQVMRLRNRIGPHLIRTGSNGYTMTVPPDSVDLLRFRRLVAESQQAVADPRQELDLLEQALALWRGEAFSDVLSAWLDREVVPGLAEERFCALERRLDLELAAGRHRELIAELTELTRAHPTRETLWFRLILALHRAGRRAEALTAYQTVRGNLLDELGLDPSDELRRLHQVVLSAVPAAGPLDLDPPPAGPGPVPRQLPADTPGFVGRDDELADLADLAGEPATDPATLPVRIGVLDGTAGVGKTALAVHWAHQTCGRFPDGQLYLNLRGYGPGAPMEPAVAAETLLRSLGVPAHRIPAGLDDRSALLRSATTSRQLLLLLDNARDSDQVRPLLPGPGCLVLITSRSQLRGLAARDGARRLSLPRLPVPDAVALLTRDLDPAATAHPAGPEPARELVELCARLPLAIRIAAERIGRHPDLQLAELAAELRDQRYTLDALDTQDGESASVRAVFAWSYHALDAETARLFRLLGCWPGADITPPAAAALADLPVHVTRRLLDRLVGVHLLEIGRPDRYRCHDLLRVYAAEQAWDLDPEQVRRAALTRALDWYLRTVRRATGRCGWSPAVLDAADLPDPAPGSPEPPELPELPDRPAALSWLESELDNLPAIVACAAGQDQPHGWQLPLLLRRVLGLGDHREAWLALYRSGLAAAQRAGAVPAQAVLLNGLGMASLRYRNPAEALAWFRQALALCQRLRDRAGTARVLINIGYTHFRMGRHQDAVDWIGRGVELDPDSDTTAEINLGAVYGALGT